MRNINIFIAGAKDLIHIREVIKAMVLDMNHSLGSRGYDISLRACSYENFRNNQEEYNNYICNVADLVIFILEDKIGPYTRDEYILAVNNEKICGHPSKLVFLKKYKEVTPEISYINGLMANDDYYIEYEDESDLRYKVRTHIDNFINASQLAKQRKSENKSSAISAKTFFRRLKFLLNFFVLIVILFFVSLIYYRTQKPILLIAGGGSARNYIEKYNNLVLEEYPQSYYVHMPTSNAWLLLTEEVISPQEKTRYYPVCVSASTAKEEDFLQITTRENFLKEGSVIKMTLGYDTLAVCLKNDKNILHSIELDGYSAKDISVESLAKIISNHDAINIFATSHGSGTRTTYEKLLSKRGVNLNEHCFNQFSEYSDFPSINKNGLPYLLLGSKCYSMKDLRNSIVNKDVLELRVFDNVDNRKEFSCKPINLYFMAYKLYNTNDLVIPQQTIDFLNSLGCNLKNKVKNNMIKRYTTDSVILEFERLPEM